MRAAAFTFALAAGVVCQDSFTVLQVADLHYDGKMSLEPVKQAIKFSSADIVFFTGDNCATGDFELQKALKAQFEGNCFFVRGNNDSEHFEEVFGPSNYWFEYRGVRFVAAAQDVDLELRNAGKLAGREGVGAFSDIRWIKEKLDCDRFTVFVTHSPVIPFSSVASFQMMDAHPNLGMYGHLHTFLQLQVGKSLHVTAPTAFNNEFVVYKFQNDSVTVSKISCASPVSVLESKQYQMALRISDEKKIEVRTRQAQPLAVLPIDLNKNYLEVIKSFFQGGAWDEVLNFYPLARNLQVKPYDHVPDFVPAGEPLFKFLHFSDTHYSGGDDSHLDAALDFANKSGSDFVLFTGDNAQRGVLEQHKKLKEKLSTLKIPYRIIKGDNDARHYEEVFGTSNWAFEYGGLRFIGMGMDSDKELAGYGFYDNAWLEKVMGKKSETPTFILTHVPVFPACSLGAIGVHQIAMKHENFNGYLSGHIHFDYEFEVAGRKSLWAPAATWNTNTIKEYQVHKDRIVVTNFTLDGRKYEHQTVYQVIWLRKPLSDCKREFSNEVFRPAKPTEFWK